MAGILEIGVSGLLAFQRSLNTTGHNIANSDTVGYSRQRTILSTQVPQIRGSSWIGSGVKVAGVQRTYDDFLATQMRSAQSTASELGSFFDHASRIDNLLADPNVGLDPTLQGFFDAMQVAADDPSSIPGRQLLLAESRSLVDRFHHLSGQFESQRDQLNQELASVSNEINGLAESLARVNQSIIEALGASGGADPNDLLDQREVLLNELSQRVEITTVAQDDGAWNVFVGKGQALVMGGVASKLTTRPGTPDASRHDIAMTTQSGTQIITDQLAGGEIGGLLSYRSQMLDPAQNQLGLVAIGIGERVNAQHALGLDLEGNVGGAVFSSPQIQILSNGGPAVTATMVDSGNLTASDYQLELDGGGQLMLTRLNDGQTFGPLAVGTTAEIDGFTLDIPAGIVAGDQYLVQPTRQAASQLELEIRDPRKFALAGPLRTQPGSNSGNAAISQPDVASSGGLPLAGPVTLTWTADVNGDGTSDDPGFNVNGPAGATTLAYDPTSDSSGATFSLAAYGDASFTVTGVPAEGDQFVIDNNSNGVGDNRNALLLAELQISDTMVGGTATFQEAYGQLVSDMGSRTHHADVNRQSSEGLLERHQMSLSSVNGVNLDEEAANLVKYQQAYQAAAQVVAVAGSLFDTLIGAVRR